MGKSLSEPRHIPPHLIIPIWSPIIPHRNPYGNKHLVVIEQAKQPVKQPVKQTAEKPAFASSSMGKSHSKPRHIPPHLILPIRTPVIPHPNPYGNKHLVVIDGSKKKTWASPSVLKTSSLFLLTEGAPV